MFAEDRMGFGIHRFPIQIEEFYRLAAECPGKSECVLDQLSRVEPSIVIRLLQKTKHLAKITLFAAFIADLLQV